MKERRKTKMKINFIEKKETWNEKNKKPRS
jgi:hypothetical protein